jgi:hypothetical protein
MDDEEHEPEANVSDRRYITQHVSNAPKTEQIRRWALPKPGLYMILRYTGRRRWIATTLEEEDMCLGCRPGF